MASCFLSAVQITSHRHLQSKGLYRYASSVQYMRIEAKKGSNATKAVAKANLPTKTCLVCNRPFTWWVILVSHQIHLTKVGIPLCPTCRIYVLMVHCCRRKKWEKCWEEVK